MSDEIFGLSRHEWRALLGAAELGDVSFAPGTDYQSCGVRSGGERILEMLERAGSLPDARAIARADLIVRLIRGLQGAL